MQLPNGRTGLRHRLDLLAHRYDLPEGAGEKLWMLLELVAGDPRAPTTVRDPERVLDDHVADSLVALELVEARSASAFVDLGAGAGFPGLPLAIALPAADVFLIESNGRKCAFISGAINACELRNAEVVHARAEAWTDGIGKADLVTARALGPLDLVAEYAAPLLRCGGVLVAWRGQRDLAAEQAAERAASELGLEVHEPRPVAPYAGTSHRHLHLMSKVRKTPERFPRRPGVAHKRPLGARIAQSDRTQR
jgi:16S rRNA (guanine527-N7)-methyltransferase